MLPSLAREKKEAGLLVPRPGTRYKAPKMEKSFFFAAKGMPRLVNLGNTGFDFYLILRGPPRGSAVLRNELRRKKREEA